MQDVMFHEYSRNPLFTLRTVKICTQRNPKSNTKLDPNPNSNTKTNLNPKTNPNPCHLCTVEKTFQQLKNNDSWRVNL